MTTLAAYLFFISSTFLLTFQRFVQTKCLLRPCFPEHAHMDFLVFLCKWHTIMNPKQIHKCHITLIFIAIYCCLTLDKLCFLPPSSWYLGHSFLLWIYFCAVHFIHTKMWTLATVVLKQNQSVLIVWPRRPCLASVVRETVESFVLDVSTSLHGLQQKTCSQPLFWIPRPYTSQLIIPVLTRNLWWFHKC